MNKIYVGNLPFKISEDELRSLFSQFGDIVEAALIKDRFTGEPKGFAFVTFENAAAAQEALKLDGTEFGGRQIRVSIAREGGGKRPGGDRGGRREHRGGGGHHHRGDRGDRGDRGGRGEW